MSIEGSEAIDFLEKLPQECMEEVVSRTGPMEACRLSIVSKRFLSAAESNAVWERFLPYDYQQLLNRADDLANTKFANKKDLFLFLIGNHVIIDGNTLCFWLHKRSGKKCFLINPSFTGHIDEVRRMDPESWCRQYEKSRFHDRATRCYEIIFFQVGGKISTCILSPDTTYTIYLVYHSFISLYNEFGFDEPVEVSIGLDGVESIKNTVYLNPDQMRLEGEKGIQYPQQRKDDRFEVELGEYFNRGGEEWSLEISLMEVRVGSLRLDPVLKALNCDQRAANGVSRDGMEAELTSSSFLISSPSSQTGGAFGFA